MRWIVYGNPLGLWLVALAVAGTTLAGLGVLKRALVRRLAAQPSSRPRAVLLAELINRTRPEFMRRFAQAGIEFAYPTQTLHVAGQPVPAFSDR